MSSLRYLDYTLLVHLVSACRSSEVLPSLGAAICSFVALWGLAYMIYWLCPGGTAWGKAIFVRPNGRRFCPPIPGPRGLPLVGSLLSFARCPAAHRRLAALASHYGARRLMALSMGATRVVVASEPNTARDILCSAAFAERPLTQSAKQLLFDRAVGFAPSGAHWRQLRRLAAGHLFSPRRLAAHLPLRQSETAALVSSLAKSDARVHTVRPFLQHTSLNTIMATVFGRRYAYSQQLDAEAAEVQSMVREGFELLGAFNLVDHLPELESVDPLQVRQRCADLVPRVYAFVQKIIDEHRNAAVENSKSANDTDAADFVDVLLRLEGDEKLSDADMVSILWEMIFRGSDTMAILTEWVLAELALHPEVQEKLYDEIQCVLSGRCEMDDGHIARMPYLQAVVKETLRVHPPGPLLSWARLAVHDVDVAGHFIPAGTTAMVNMWAITHDSSIWAEPNKFAPERFIPSMGGRDVDVRGNDLTLAPFGAGARVCPGRAMALANVHLWVANLVQHFKICEDMSSPINLGEVLKLSCEMATPLSACFTPRPSVLTH